MTLVCSACSAGGEFIIQATTTSVIILFLSHFMVTSGYRPTLVPQNGKSQNLYTQKLTLFPGPNRKRERVWFQSFVHVLNCSGIPLPPHTVDIFLYTHDANIDTEHYTVHRFIIGAYSMQETHFIALNQWPI